MQWGPFFFSGESIRSSAGAEDRESGITAGESILWNRFVESRQRVT